MEIRLSYQSMDSFAGNVLPLQLLGVEEFGMEEITWSSTSPCVQIRSFRNEKADPFTDGVLLTLLSPGNATVSASYKGNEYTCAVSIHAPEHTESERSLSYFLGDFHDHTQQTHKYDEFVRREEFTPYDYLKLVKDEGVFDFSVVTDHACLLGGKDYFRGFRDSFLLEDEAFVPFAGSEAQCTPKYLDRYGVTHAEGGEIVIVNADNCYSGGNWEDFFSKYDSSPFAICVLAHPQISGHSIPGIWNNRLDKNNSPRFKEMVKGVEIGNGTDRNSNHANEYIYSVALDNGFDVGTTCSSDSHGPVWGAAKMPGRTVIMAKERSKEAFFDALNSRRFYATESGNVKLYYEVNGKAAPCTLSETAKYRFHVEIGLFNEEKGGMPKNIQVISDYGNTIFETDDVQNVMDFTVESATARYFYLRLTDEKGQKTWSVAVKTGRRIDPTEKTNYSPIPKNGWTAIDEESGADASVLVNDDPWQAFFAEKATASILVDMKNENEISAFGLFHTIVINKELAQMGIQRKERISELPVRYEIETGTELENMTLKAKGLFRVFGDESVIPLTTHKARYLRLRILSTTGKESGRKDYFSRRPTMAEISLYTK